MRVREPSPFYWWFWCFAVAGAGLLAGCSDPPPRFGEATISAAAPRALLTGTTWGEAPALELAPGCPGYLDPALPAHLVRVDEPIEVLIRARSDQGPLALAVARGDEVHCASDGGAGHAPTLTFRGPGELAVYVASLRAPAELPYALSVHDAKATPEEASEPRPSEVSVTITSEPSGATVRDAEGKLVGTTPAMFVLPLPESEPERRWELELDGHRPTSIAGRLAPGALALHAKLAAEEPASDEPAEDTPRPRARGERARPSTPPRQPSASARIPEVPPHAEIVAVLSRLSPAATQRCPPPEGTTVRVYFTLTGSGRVQRVTTSGSASPAFQSCIARLVRGARFPRFRRGSIDVDHTYSFNPTLDFGRPAR